jgi:hypothetical protein
MDLEVPVIVAGVDLDGGATVTRTLVSRERGPPQAGFRGLIGTGVALEALRISAGSGRVQLSAAELEEHMLRNPYAPVIVCTSGSP